MDITTGREILEEVNILTQLAMETFQKEDKNHQHSHQTTQQTSKIKTKI